MLISSPHGLCILSKGMITFPEVILRTGLAGASAAVPVSRSKQIKASAKVEAVNNRSLVLIIYMARLRLFCQFLKRSKN